MKKIYLLILLATISTKAFATVPVFGEIYLGADTSKIAATDVTGPNESGTNKASAVVGLRGGYQYSVFMLGVDAMGTAGYLNYDSPLLKSGYWNKTNIYLMGGFDFGTFRIWGDYGVFNQMDLLLDYGTYKTDKLYTGGTSIKVGAGLRLSNRISVNVDYYVNSPNKMQNSTGQVNWNNTYSNFQETGYVFSISYLVNDSEITRK